mgnify:CR=1 FL=1|tara:strand:+ start:5063 stop:5587 length:525 start_codon:yes stop_codon:yes gene_type:complete
MLKSVNNIIKIFLLIFFVYITGCNKSELDPNRPIGAEDKRRKNIEEGRGVSLGGIVGKARGGTNYEFSTSNPMWRASLETLDFLPLTTVDYSGGVIITDWYSDNNKKESIKITLRFLSNEIRSDSIKIIVHKKICNNDFNCSTSLVASSVIKDELRSTILRKASLFEKAGKNKK